MASKVIIEISSSSAVGARLYTRHVRSPYPTTKNGARRVCAESAGRSSAVTSSLRLRLSRSAQAYCSSSSKYTTSPFDSATTT